MRTLGTVGALLGTVAIWTWVRLYPGPTVQAALDTYAPGLALGGFVPVGSPPYTLRIAPYLGYRDSTYQARGGLHDVGVEVNEHVDDGRPQVSRFARIAAVELRSPDARSTAVLEADLTRRLGHAELRCYVGGRTRWRSAFWSGWNGRGVQLQVARGPALELLPQPFDPVTGGALVRFGAERPTLANVQPEPC